MNRISLGLCLGLVVSVAGCDGAEDAASGADCRRAADACAPGYRCLPVGGGAFDCVPGRDAMVAEMDMLVPPLLDQGLDEDGGPNEQDSDVLADAAPMMTSDSEPMMTSDSGPMTLRDMGITDPDAAVANDGGIDGDADGPEEDLGPGPIADAAPMPDAAPVVDADLPDPVIDEGVPEDPDAAVIDPVDMGGGNFGPGRCNHDGVSPREARDIGGQDQNGARQIQPGVYRGLTVGGADFSDWYRVEVCEDGVLDITVEHGFNGVDLDLDVWHPNEGRLGQSQEPCAGRESYRWQNLGEIVDIRFNVYPWAPPGRNGNNTYSLSVSVACP